MPKMNIDSPCKNQCLYDNRYGFCVECGRTMHEVSNWTRFSPVMRGTINRKAEDRLSLIRKDK